MVKNRMKTIKEYDIMRVIITVIVIIDHSIYYRIITNYGSIDCTPFTMSGLSMIYHILLKGKSLINTFHMPLYMMLSGALFKYREYSYSGGGIGGYPSLRILVIDKAKKLLFPFIIVTLFYVAPIKYISGYYLDSANVIEDIIIGQIFLQGNNHLWFLPTLFLIFMLSYQLWSSIKKRRIKQGLIILLSVLCVYLSEYVTLSLMRYVLKYVVWFNTGYLFEDHRENFNLSIMKHFFHPMIAVCIWIALAFTNSKLMTNECWIYVFIKPVYGFLCTLFGCFSVYSICYILSKTRLTMVKLFQQVRRNTLGLYLYSDPINYLILSHVVLWFGQDVFLKNIGSLILFVTRFILTGSIAYGISSVLRNCRMRYLY